MYRHKLLIALVKILDTVTQKHEIFDHQLKHIQNSFLYFGGEVDTSNIYSGVQNLRPHCKSGIFIFHLINRNKINRIFFFRRLNKWKPRKKMFNIFSSSQNFALLLGLFLCTKCQIWSFLSIKACIEMTHWWDWSSTGQEVLHKHVASVTYLTAR